MAAPKYFQQLEGHAIFRPSGELKLTKMGEMVTAAISYARATGERRLMVVLTEVTGYPPPKLTARYRMVREWLMGDRCGACFRRGTAISGVYRNDCRSI
ncbi:MAG: hypothetical protein WAW39_05450 [Prosthecobacter sp.]|uniref:hypothetical protein n=1 Tax=Prosthecobacter sp. TaxID=1965333 RepID=UPI003BAE4849